MKKANAIVVPRQPPRKPGTEAPPIPANVKDHDIHVYVIGGGKKSFKAKTFDEAIDIAQRKCNKEGIVIKSGEQFTYYPPHRIEKAVIDP